MLLIRNGSLTTGTTTPVAASYPTSPAPMGGSSLLIAIVNIDGVAATGIAASGWTSAGAAITNGTTVQQCFYRSAAGNTGTTSFSWTGASTYAEVFIFEVYSTQGSVPTIGTYAHSTGTSTAATCPSPTLSQASELVLFCVTLAANTNILYPGGPSFASGFGGGANTLYTNLNASTRSCIGWFGVQSTTLPATMPATSWSGSQAFVITALPILEATGGDPISSGTGLADTTVGGSANVSTTAAIPATAIANDILIAVVAQGKTSGSQATGQTVYGSDIFQVSNGNFQSGSPFSITLPAAAKTGDMLLCLMGAFNDQVGTYSAPGTMTTIANTAGTVGHPAQGLFYHIVTGGETPGTTTYSFSISGSAQNSNVCWVLVRSLTGATLSGDQTSATSAASSGTGNFATVATAVVNEQVFYVISQTTSAPGLGAGITAIYTGTGTVIGWAPQGAATTTPTVTYTSGRTDGITTTFSIKSSTPSPWTHIRQDNEPLSTFSLDLFWLKLPSGLPTKATFGVGSAVENLQAQIFAFANLSTSAPIDDNQGNAQVGNYSDWDAPPVPGVTANTGLVLWVWGANYSFNNGSNNLWVLSPVGLLTDTIGTAGGGAPQRHFQVGFGTPDMAESPQFCRAGSANGFGLVASSSAISKAYVSQSLALKAASGPVYNSNNLEVNSVLATVMGSSIAPASAGWFWSINPFQM
jgi:hypothetical protein